MIIEIFRNDPLRIAKNLVCLDRDDTIIFDSGYMGENAEIHLNFPLVESLKRQFGLNASFCLVSNQSGVGRGILSIEAVINLNRRVEKVLSSNGIHLTLSIFCHHLPSDFCNCRKPQPTMLKVARSLHYSLGNEVGVMYGDKDSDQESAIAAGFEFVKIPLLH
jgi:D-glycero-D-manno-heptose 1,7-bisphosphate phosphatase